MIRIASLLLLALAAAPAVPAAAAAAPLELPGDFAESTTLDELRTRFGAEAVRLVETPEPDGGVRRSVVLFPDDPSRRAYVEFHDAGTPAGIASITVRDRGSAWRGKGGVHVGMSFAELRRANGGPFLIQGFDEDGRARVRDGWSPAPDDDAPANPGRLDVGDGDRMYFGVDLGLAADVPPDAIPRDDGVSSDDPRWPRLGDSVEVTAIVASTSLDDEWE